MPVANGPVPDAAANPKTGNSKTRRNLKKKQKKKIKRAQAATAPAEDANREMVDAAEAAPDVEVEYVADLGVDEQDPNYQEWHKIFKFFNPDKPVEGEEETNKEDDAVAAAIAASKAAAKRIGIMGGQVEDSDSDDEQNKEPKISKKKRKLASRLSIAELKQLVKRPDVVEIWDVTAADPRLLVYLKSYRNTVPVPRHWCNKRKYLQGKRGIEKAPFKLPEFIETTGIARIREAYQEKEDAKSLKQKQRERMTPKMNKMDIDYQVLHDAFFKYQTKPKLSGHGDLYYEGKEFEVKLKEKRPGCLSEELKRALGMPDTGPQPAPPWLINMQRYGPPPSYPSLKIAGLNAPIPPGAAFGYHPGGWGKPPVDEYGRPLYGDVFGTQGEWNQQDDDNIRDPVDRKWWGEVEDDEESEAGDDDDQDSNPEEGDDDDGSVMEGAEVASGISSVTSGLETPGTVDPRKASGLETPDSMVDVRKPKALYQVLEQKESNVGQAALMGSAYRYVIPADSGKGTTAKKDPRRVDLMKSQKADGVDITIDAAELEGLDEDMIKDKYDEKLAESRASREDVSDVFDEEARKAAKKRKKAAAESKSKKTKWF